MGVNIFLSVAAPVYNEEDNIEGVLKYWDAILDSAEFPSEIVLTDDGSTDGTPAVLERLEAEIPRLRVLTLDRNMGYGRAISNSIYATTGLWVVTIDSDGQFDLREFSRLIEKAVGEGLDAVIGYREKKQDSLFRVVADRVLNLIVRALFWVSFTDTNCALRVVKGEFLRRMEIESRGYSAPTEIVIKLNEMGASMAEAPVTHSERKGGESKLGAFTTTINFLRFLFYLRKKRALYRSGIIDKF